MDDADEREVSVTSDYTDPLVGRDFMGKYRIRNKLGEGGFGTVYRAIQLAVGREVAVKVLRPDRATDPALRETLVKRFQREAIAMSKLGHPNTVQLIDFGTTEDDILFLVLELLSGFELSHVVARQAPIRPSRVAHICRQICMSLGEAHSSGIIHRDLKPGNVFLCHVEGDDDYVKVMDFGIARVITADDEFGNLTRTGMTQGTPAYMAPEQAMALKTTPASDLYSLGCMMYEMLTGEMPFTGDSSMAISLAHVNDPPPTLAIPGDSGRLSRSWNELFQQLLEKKKKNRIQSAQELAERFETLQKLADPGLEDPLDSIQEDKTVLVQPALRVQPAEDELKTVAQISGLREPSGEGTEETSRPSPIARILAFSVLLALAIVGLMAMFNQGAPKKTSSANASTVLAPTQDTIEPAEPAPAIEPTRETPTSPALASPPVDAPETPKLAHLVLASEPSGALVYRAHGDSEVLLCSTPCDVKVPAGEDVETLTVRADGRKDKELQVNLGEGAQVVLAINLETIKRKRSSRRGQRASKRRPGASPPANLPALRTGP